MRCMIYVNNYVVYRSAGDNSACFPDNSAIIVEGPSKCQSDKNASHLNNFKCYFSKTVKKNKERNTFD